MKRIIVAALLLLIFTAPFCFAADANLKVQVNVNGSMLIPGNGFPRIKVDGSNIIVGSGGSYYSKEQAGANPASFKVEKNFEYILKAIVPSGSKEKKISIKLGGPDNVNHTLNITCDPSNKLIVKNYRKGTTVPVQAKVYLVRKQSGGDKLHGEKHTDGNGTARFDKVWRGYQYYVQGRPDSDQLKNVQVPVAPFLSDFQERTITLYYSMPKGQSDLAPGSGIEQVPAKPQVVN